MEECIICFDETTEFIFYRCAHKVCEKCFPKIKTCPICNTPREIQIVVHRPHERVEIVPEIMTTYNLILCIGSFLVIGAFTLYFNKRR